MATIDQFLTSLRDEFGEQLAGKKFEVFCKWFLENDPEWSKRINKIWLWDDYPNKWQRQDLGTDLVFEDKEGLIWAVQAKCYSEDRSTIKKHMDSFLADSGRKQVHKRLWIQTTNKMEVKAVKTLTGQDKPVTVFSLRDFQASQIDYPSSYAELYQGTVKDKPRPDTHQIEAIKAVKLRLQLLDRGQMIMACGTGKTFTTLWIKEALNAHTTLVLLPSLSLLSQTMREWAWAGNTDFDILNVCSDKSVGKKTEDMDPSDTPFPVTSKVDEIARFIKTPNPKVIFCTYQSSPLIAEAQLDPSVPAFDLTIADEAHRCAGKADAGFATVLNTQKIRSSKRLFTTATPRYFGKAVKDESKVRGVAVVGMNDESVFGPVIHTLTFGEAIRRDLLNDYQVVIVGVDEPMVKQWIDNYEIVATNPDEHTDARTLAAKIGLIKAIKDYELKRVISFHSRVKGAKEFSEELVNVVDLIDPVHRPEGLFLADYVSGEMSAGDRKDKIDRLKVLEGYDRGILTNARCLAEGVDVPSLDGVAFIDPKGSQVEIIQAVGRAIRKVRGADVQIKGTIVIPVFIEDGDDPEKSIEASNFKPVWDVLKALRAHDEVLADTLNQYRTDMAKAGSQRCQTISGKLVFNLPISVDVDFSNALWTFLVESTTSSWEFWFGLLESYNDEFGNCLVSIVSKYRNYNLARWVQSQRKQKAQLLASQVKRLNDLGFVWNVIEYQWEEGFNHLCLYQETYGDCLVAQKNKYQSYNLGQWVGKQRQSKDNLSEDQVSRLESLGFVWDTVEYQWNRGFEYLVAYKKEFGNCLVVGGSQYHDYHLGHWVSALRTRKDKLSEGQISQLDALGFVWGALEYRWQKGYDLLVDYKIEFGDCLVPGDYQYYDYNLGNWVTGQRTRKNKILVHQVKRLDDLGFVWNISESEWEKNFKDLVAYKEEFGDCLVKRGPDHQTNKLGTWVQNQRQSYGAKKLEKDQVSRLESLGFVWDTYEYQWNRGFAYLVAYKEEFGNCLVAGGSQYHDYNLGQWVSMLRTKKDKLSEGQISQLDALGFVWDAWEYRWQEGYDLLVDYKIEFGDCLVSQNYTYHNYNLGMWVSRLRSKKDKITPEQHSLLNQLEFVWEPTQSLWEENFKSLIAYKKEFGDCLVPFHFGDNKLVHWVSTQRQRYNAKRLDKDRIRRLNDLGFIWDALIAKWEIAYNNLLAYKDEFGDCSVTVGYKMESGYDLGQWVQKQRSNYNLKKLDQDYYERLDELGFVWAANLLTHRWEQGYSELLTYKEEFGHCLVPETYVPVSGYNLATWILTQRNSFKNGQLDKNRLKKLDELGFVWSANQFAWERGYEELMIHKGKLGSCSVHVEYKTKSGLNLNGWIGSQRQLLKNNKLDKDQIRRLDELGFIWDAFNEKWEKGFTELLAYKKEFGDCIAPRGYKTKSGLNLNNWISSQRQLLKNNKLDKDQIRRLDELGFIWDAFNEKWEKGFTELLAYKKEFGDCLPPKGYKTKSGYNLYSWVGSQKTGRKINTLEESRIDRLDELGFVWEVK